MFKSVNRLLHFRIGALNDEGAPYLLKVKMGLNSSAASSMDSVECCVFVEIQDSDANLMACASLRVTQVDANILDGEFRQLMVKQLEQIIMEMPVNVGRFIEDVRPELELLLDGIIWTSRAYRGASPGQIEVDVSYKNNSSERIWLHFVFTMLLPYMIKRISTVSEHSTARKLFAKMGAVVEALHILHHLNFLRVGGHSTLVESFLDLKTWSNTQPSVGTINYESQNRELLWHTFRDALLLLWPVVRFISARWRTRARAGVVSPRRNEVALRCGLCEGAAVVPLRASGCGHIACYWCVMSRMPTESDRCAICGEKASQIIPARGHALV